jgi:hypothetical protein
MVARGGFTDGIFFELEGNTMVYRGKKSKISLVGDRIKKRL